MTKKTTDPSKKPAKTSTKRKTKSAPKINADEQQLLEEPAPVAEPNAVIPEPPDVPVEILTQDAIPEFSDVLNEEQLAQYEQILTRWSYFEITVTSPELPVFDPPQRVQPEKIAASEEVEFVYPILDYGHRMITSKQHELFSSGLSMCKLHYTIEKIIALLIQRLKDQGVTTDEEVHVRIDGSISSRRKAFESIINLEFNLVIDNFDPGAWGEKYLSIIKNQKYGYPPPSPRDVYHRTYHTSKSTPKTSS